MSPPRSRAAASRARASGRGGAASGDGGRREGGGGAGDSNRVSPTGPRRAAQDSERPHASAGGRADGSARVAVIAQRGKFLVAEPFFSAGPRLAITRDRSAGVGDLVVVRAATGRDGRPRGRAVISRRLGRPEVARDVIEALMVDRGLRRSFDPAVEHEARGVAEPPGAELAGDSRAGERDLAARRDLRALRTFTIDPASARDFDDAISAVALDDGGWRVWVHIADVSAYVKPRSLIDREAYRRATSVYVPGAVEPMLPAQLSNHACSLVPGQDRLAVTVEMTIRGQQVVSAAFHRSLIRSDRRLEYGFVDRVFAGQEPAPEPWGPALSAARAAAAALGARRAAHAALVVDSQEPEFSFDERGDVVGVTAVAQTESHRLIEQLMIASNEQVAGLLSSRRLPTLYRVHERPDAPAVQALVDQLRSLGVPTPPVPRHMTPQQAADVVGEVSQLVARHVARTGRGTKGLTRLLLRSLKQAYYDRRNIGHAGLQSPRYCHFTSPIRRYPDLICHRGLLSAVAAEPPPDASWVASAGPWTSAREREAMTIERDCDDVARCFLLERQLFAGDPDQVFAGEVVGVIGAGAFVAFGPGAEFEGMLAVRRLRGDWWELNETGTMLVAVHGSGAIRIGDPIDVRVARVDAPRGRVDLLAAGDEG